MADTDMTAALARLEERSLATNATAERIERRLEYVISYVDNRITDNRAAIDTLEKEVAAHSEHFKGLEAMIAWGGGIISAVLSAVAAKMLNLI